MIYAYKINVLSMLEILRVESIFRTMYYKICNGGLYLLIQQKHLRKFNSPIILKWFAKLLKVSTCPQMFFQRYSNYCEPKKNDYVERCDKICEKIFINDSNS